MNEDRFSRAESMTPDEFVDEQALELLRWPPLFVGPDGRKTVRYTVGQWEILARAFLGGAPSLALMEMLGAQSAS